MEGDGMIPATEAAVRVGVSRERVLRALQQGRIEGGQICGRWVVSPSGLETLHRIAAAEHSPAQAGGTR